MLTERLPRGESAGMLTFQGRAIALTIALGELTFVPRLARAEAPIQSDPAPAQASPQPDLPPQASETEPDSAAQAAPAKPGVVPSKAPERQVSLEPAHSAQPPPGRTTFDIDPIADSALIAASLAFAGTLELINSTGEIRPQQIAPDFHSSQLLAIDRNAVTSTHDPNAHTYSSIGVAAALAFAVVDPIISGVREKSVQTALADAFMYAESLSFTLAMTNMVKIAVRRPRPIAYTEAEAHKDDPNYSNSNTDSALSFFSSHTAVTAAISATATYLAFARAPNTARPWITLAIGAGLTTFVAIERVRAGQHFPTDVIAGGIAGAGIGVVVPHLHRSEDIKQRRIWVGFTPLTTREGERGGVLNVSGQF